jgi:hypothetical protein
MELEKVMSFLARSWLRFEDTRYCPTWFAEFSVPASESRLIDKAGFSFLFLDLAFSMSLTVFSAEIWSVRCQARIYLE